MFDKIIPTLLFSSFSKKGFLGRMEGEGISVLSWGSSGFTDTIPEIKTHLVEDLQQVHFPTQFKYNQNTAKVNNNNNNNNNKLKRFYAYLASLAFDRLLRSLLHQVERQSNCIKSQLPYSSLSPIFYHQSTEKNITIWRVRNIIIKGWESLARIVLWTSITLV